MRIRRIVLGLLASLLLVGSIAWRVSGKTQAAVVTFTCCSYSPDTVTIRVGEDVTWQGNFIAHPLVSQDGLWSTVNSGMEFTHTFTQPGAYWYYCAIHGGPDGFEMSGRVIVLDSQTLFLPFLNR